MVGAALVADSLAVAVVSIPAVAEAARVNFTAFALAGANFGLQAVAFAFADEIRSTTPSTTTPVNGARGGAKILNVAGETTPGVPGSYGAGTVYGETTMRRTSSTFGVQNKVVEGDEIAASELVRDMAVGAYTTGGKINGVLSGKTYQLLFESMLRNRFSNFTGQTQAVPTTSSFLSNGYGGFVLTMTDGTQVSVTSPITSGIFVGAAVLFGLAGTNAGSAVFNNANSGSITVTTPTGALGSATLTLPDVTGVLGVLPSATTSQLYGGTGLPWITSIYNNISRTNYVTGGNLGGGGYVYAALTGNTSANLTWGGASTQNIFYGIAGTCTASCDSGNNVVAYNGGSFGTNTYLDAAFSNTTDLLANWAGSPASWCNPYADVVSCMGGNYLTQAKRSLSVIGDLNATAGGTSGKGYQLPATACTADADYPTWLKGIVYLQWNGSTITENPGLVTKPCGL